MPTCAICQFLGVPLRAATGTVGLLTSSAELAGSALERFEDSGEEKHVLVHACPEHVVDVYRGRIEGVRMAWRLAETAG